MKNILIKLYFQLFIWIPVFHIVIFVLFVHNASAYSTNNICITKGCAKQAQQLQNLMNPKADPCEDFYEFTCGNFIKQSIIPDHQTGISMMGRVIDDVNNKLKSLFEQPITATEYKYSALVKTYYQSCMDEQCTESKKLKPIEKVLKYVIGGWPVVSKSSWNSTYFDWELATHRCAKIECIYTAFIDIDNSADAKNTTRNLLKLKPALLGLDKSQFFPTSDSNKKIIKAYFTNMVNVAVLFGAEKQIAQNELWDALQFETKLAKISLLSSLGRDDMLHYNPLTIHEMQKNYPNIKWLKYINGILQPNERIRKDETVIVEEPKYISEFETLIVNTPKKTLANYMGWRIINDLTVYLTDAIREEGFKLTTVLTGITKKPPRWTECVTSTKILLGRAVDAMYVQKYFNKKSRRKIVELVKNLREQVTIALKQLSWMDQETKRKAVDKAVSMSQIIVYPDELLNNQLIDEFYAHLKINKKYFLKSYLNITVFNNPFYDLHIPVDRADWRTFSATEVNAYYARFLNSIRLTAGILQGMIFDNDRPNYMNFGGTGFIIAHEIMHGFDDQGSNTDKNGNMISWWKPETKDAFLKKAQCIVDQYGNYTVPEINLNLNGKISQGENIADNGGIKQSYYAYRRWVQKHGPEPMLPGLSYTPEQMFWISAASVWCEKKRPEALKSLVTTDGHPPARYRILGSFSNQKEFAKDFNCPVGSAMNPQKKCVIW